MTDLIEAIGVAVLFFFMLGVLGTLVSGVITLVHIITWGWL
jgi:hypothetical protein